MNARTKDVIKERIKAELMTHLSIASYIRNVCIGRLEVRVHDIIYNLTAPINCGY